MKVMSHVTLTAIRCVVDISAGRLRVCSAVTDPAACSPVSAGLPSFRVSTCMASLPCTGSAPVITDVQAVH